jgi:hypothetical protein
LKLGSGGVSAGRDDDNAPLDGFGAIGHGRAGGDAGSYLEGEQAFACAVIAVQERDACKRETVMPEPADGLGCGFGEIVVVDGEGHG